MKTTKTIAAALLTGLLLSGAAMAQAERTDDGYGVQMKLEGNEFVLRGNPGDQCGILIGMQELDDVRLPGGARLHLQPLAILAHGRFNADGEYRYDWSQWGFEKLPQALAQALSYNAETNTFESSKLMRTGGPDGSSAELSRDAADRRADTARVNRDGTSTVAHDADTKAVIDE